MPMARANRFHPRLNLGKVLPLHILDHHIGGGMPITRSRLKHAHSGLHAAHCPNARPTANLLQPLGSPAPPGWWRDHQPLNNGPAIAAHPTDNHQLPRAPL